MDVIQKEQLKVKGKGEDYMTFDERLGEIRENHVSLGVIFLFPRDVARDGGTMRLRDGRPKCGHPDT